MKPVSTHGARPVHVVRCLSCRSSARPVSRRPWRAHPWAMLPTDHARQRLTGGPPHPALSPSGGEGSSRSMVTQVGSVKPSWRWSVVSLKSWAAKKRRLSSRTRRTPSHRRVKPWRRASRSALVHERARDAAPAMVWMHGEPADVEAAFLLVPKHGAHDDAAVVDDDASALSEVRADRVRRLLQGAGRWVGLSRLSGKGETDQRGDRGGIRYFSRPDAPGLRHTTPRSILTPA